MTTKPKRRGPAAPEPTAAYSDGEALLRAICETPDEDTPRLVYADWLQENGEPERASFVRKSIELASERPDPRNEDHWCMALMGNGLWLRSRDEWKERCGALPQTWGWHRGECCEVRGPLAWFLDHAEAIFRRHPVTTVRLTDRKPSYRTVGGQHEWGWCLMANGALFTGDGFWIPPALFRELPSWARPWANYWRVHSTESGAHAALSFAAVNVGRKLAGLTPLPEPEPTK